jgi:hypothetical protein
VYFIVGSPISPVQCDATLEPESAHRLGWRLQKSITQTRPYTVIRKSSLPLGLVRTAREQIPLQDHQLTNSLLSLSSQIHSFFLPARPCNIAPSIKTPRAGWKTGCHRKYQASRGPVVTCPTCSPTPTPNQRSAKRMKKKSPMSTCAHACPS